MEWHLIGNIYVNKKCQPKRERDGISVCSEGLPLFRWDTQFLLLVGLCLGKAREIGPVGICVRRFFIPAANFRATDYVDLIDAQAFYVTPPTVLRQISSLELLKMIQDDVPMDGWDFIKFPSYTQIVDRIVKLVSPVSRKRVLPQKSVGRGFMRATLESRKQMSQFEYKKRLQKIVLL
ncbi:hypothetical protein AVEN_217734-1 [Araneus ventricosus]|uniref:Uncharacterized protein n=1 Tax=Araneus ventricosus TaxID=182803 RepID=A0A4Y2QHI6_ARAVE|nr:hypothetical protein AVEN_217734-1 [Araneus ventricosus]